jgi:hypothetical protein
MTETARSQAAAAAEALEMEVLLNGFSMPVSTSQAIVSYPSVVLSASRPKKASFFFLAYARREKKKSLNSLCSCEIFVLP